MIADEEANAVVLRKVAANLKDSVFEQMNWAIRTLGVEDEWEKKWNPDNKPECPMEALEEEIKQLKQDIENAYDDLPYDHRTAGLDPAFSSWEEFYRMIL